MGITASQELSQARRRWNVCSKIVNFCGDSLLSENWSWYGGCFSIWQSELQGNMTISTNNATYGGAIQAIEATINITGNCNFSKNLATLTGGTLALAGGSVIYIFEPAILHFLENIADSLGGATYQDNVLHCIFDLTLNGFLGMYDSDKRSSYSCYESDQDLPYCFHGRENAFKINISFSGNSVVAGNVIFGQKIDKTLSNVIFSRYRESYTATVADLLFYLLNVKIDDTNNGSKISSLPNRICRCINGQP